MKRVWLILLSLIVLTLGAVAYVQRSVSPPMITLAQDATARAIEHSFALPLKAAGVEAAIHVEFSK